MDKEQKKNNSRTNLNNRMTKFKKALRKEVGSDEWFDKHVVVMSLGDDEEEVNERT